MSTPVRLALVAFAALAAGCTSTTNVPATTPTIPATTSTITPGAVITTTTRLTTTTVDRVAEITAVFEDLERRRLKAILDQDEAAFRHLYANDGFLNVSLSLFDLIEFMDIPGEPTVTVVEVVKLGDDCATAVVRTDLTGVTKGGGVAEKQQSIEYVSNNWGISYVGSDWACDGLHPFS